MTDGRHVPPEDGKKLSNVPFVDGTESREGARRIGRIATALGSGTCGRRHSVIEPNLRQPEIEMKEGMK